MEKQNRTKQLTFCGIMTALGVVLLLLASILPGARVALAATAGVVAAMTIVRGGLSYGALTVIATAVLAFLLVPGKEIALIYASFFGPYTLIKNLIERLHNFPLEWVLKLIFCVADSALLFLFADGVLDMVPDMLAAHIWIFLPVVAVIFVAYDIVFSKLIAYVFQRIHL